MSSYKREWRIEHDRKTTKDATDLEYGISLGYTAARIEAHLSGIAESMGLVPTEFTSEVANLLLGKAVRTRLGNPERVSSEEVRSKTTKPRHKRKSQKKVDARARRKRTRSGIAAYWAAMTPEQRKAEMARRTVKGLGRKKVA